MEEYLLKTRRDALFTSKTTCFTLKNSYDRERFSVISYNYLIYNDFMEIMTED